MIQGIRLRVTVPLIFRSSEGEVGLVLRDVPHVPLLSYLLFSLLAAADERHQYKGTREGVTVKLNTGGKLFFPSIGRLNFLYAYRPNALVDQTANASIAPCVTPTGQADPVNINDFHVAHAHTHEGAPGVRNIHSSSPGMW